MKKLILFLITVVSFGAHAQEENQLESWYTYWGAGYAIHSFTGDLKTISDSADSTKPVFFADVLGFYFPSASQPGWIRGFVINFDSVYQSRKDDNGYTVSSLNVGRTLFAYSNYYFFSGLPGSGFFLRGDAGFSSETISKFRTNELDVDKDVNALGVLVGVGGAVPISSGTRILFQLDYKTSFGGDDRVGATMASAGLLF